MLVVTSKLVTGEQFLISAAQEKVSYFPFLLVKQLSTAT